MSSRRRQLLALALLTSLGCGSPPTPEYVQQVQSAGKATRQGSYTAAAQAYERAARVAGSAHDAEEARYRAASSYARGGERERARALYTQLAATALNRDLRARADFELAELEADAAAVDAHRLAALRRHPSSGNARAALRQHVEYLREHAGIQAVLDFLGTESQALAATELGEALFYLRARELDGAGRSAEARDAYLSCAARYPYPRGAYWDDALFRGAEMELVLGAPERAIAHLQRLLSEREDARFVGSYEKGRYAEAQLKLGQIYRDALRDPARARSELRKVWLNHPKSRLADDALFEEALVARQSGDLPGTCAPLSILVQKLPESRYAACAHELCDALPASASPCHDYIKRDAKLP